MEKLLAKLEDIRDLIVLKILATDPNKKEQYEYIIEKCGDLEILDGLIANYKGETKCASCEKPVAPPETKKIEKRLDKLLKQNH